MIEIDVADGPKGRLRVRLHAPSQLAVTAIQSLLSSVYSDKTSSYLIAVQDFPIFEKQLQLLNAPDQGEMTPEAKRLVDKFTARRGQLLAQKTAPADPQLLQQIKGWNTQPYPDQLQCIKFHIRRGRSLEAGETGIGKTLILLYTFLYWKTVGKAQKGLILCLNSGKLDWESEVERHTNLKALSVRNGTQNVLEDLATFAKGKHDLLIVHYDCLFQDSKSTVRVFDTFKTMPFDFVALDEVHTLKNPSAKRHKRIMELVQRWGDVKLVCATGTAIDGNPKSAWAPLKLVDSNKNTYFPPYQLFYNHFVVRQPRFFGRKRVMVEVGFRNLQTLKEWMETSSIRFLKSEVLNRPSKIFQTRLVTLKGAQKEMYEQMKKAVRQEIQTDEGDNISMVGASVRMLRLRQITNHPSLAGFTKFSGQSAKYEELDEVVEEILSNPDAQLLVWTQWRDAVDLLVERYKAYNAIAFYGGSDDRAIREKVLSKQSRIVVAIPEKAGTSVDWLKVCRTAVYLEKPWYLPLYRQSLDRIDRRANTDPALIISIEAINSVDQLVNSILQYRQDVFDALTLEDAKLVALNKADLLKYLK